METVLNDVPWSAEPYSIKRHGVQITNCDSEPVQTPGCIQAHGRVTVSVKDEGQGLDTDLLPRVFEPFSRGHGQSVETPDGLGVGLTLVKRLTELHGGNVRALSAGPGRGSEFIVCLPAANDRDEVRPLRCGAGADSAPSVDRSVVGKDTDAAWPRRNGAVPSSRVCSRTQPMTAALPLYRGFPPEFVAVVRDSAR